MKLARPSRSSLARLVARTLIAALLLALIPPEVRASISSPNDTRAHPDLPLASSASHAVLLVVAVTKDPACALVFAAADPHFFGIVWDFENRLTKVTKLDGTVVEHAYDADGNRVQTKTTPPGGPTTTTNFLVDTAGSLSHIVAETDETGAVKAYYVRGDDILAVMRPLVPAPTTPADWQTRFVHADGLGSIRRLTDENGLITDGYSYSAFGELLAHTGTDPQPYAFAGEPFDSVSQLAYHRARWMDPRVGRFAGMDPFRGSSVEPATLHRYLYAGADPVDRTDPTGLDFGLSTSLASLSISFTIASISIPNARAMLNATASLEIVPIWVRDRAWKGEPEMGLLPFPGWPIADMQSHLSSARSFWGGHGITLHIGPEIGPVLVGNSTLYNNDQIPEILREVNLTSPPLNKIPVIFVRSVGGTSILGGANTTNPREQGFVVMVRNAPDTTLSHEVGHLLGLQHSWNPFGLMFKWSLGGTYLSDGEISDARKGLTIRSGGGR